MDLDTDVGTVCRDHERTIPRFGLPELGERASVVAIGDVVEVARDRISGRSSLDGHVEGFAKVAEQLSELLVGEDHFNPRAKRQVDELLDALRTVLHLGVVTVLITGSFDSFHRRLRFGSTPALYFLLDDPRCRGCSHLDVYAWRDRDGMRLDVRADEIVAPHVHVPSTAIDAHVVPLRLKT